MATNGITKGVKNALARQEHHSMCDCGFALPRYPGRYPKSCPSCGGDRETSEARVVRVGDRIEEGVVVEVVGHIAYAEAENGTVWEVDLGCF